jgi:hypothetical protein
MRFLSFSLRILALTLVMFVLADASAAIVLWLHDRRPLFENRDEMPDAAFSSADPAWPNEYFDESEVIDSSLRWHPYSYWLGSPFHGKYINVGADGLRRTWHNGFTGVISDGRPVRIFMFGGSAMWGFCAPDDTTIPSALTRFLGRAEVSAHITNFGQLGYVSTQELILLFEQLRDGNIPDLVIFYDGYNDIASAFENGAAGKTENESHRAREFNVLNGTLPSQRHALYRYALSAFAGHLAIVRFTQRIVRKICPNCLEPPDLSTASFVDFSARPENTREDLSRVVVEKYLANVRLIAQTGRHLGYRGLFYWQPALYGRSSLSPYEEKLKSYYVLGEKEFFSASYAVAQQEAMDPKIPKDERPIYLQDVLPQHMPCFVDAVHISGPCNEFVARRIATDVVAVLGKQNEAKDSR